MAVIDTTTGFRLVAPYQPMGDQPTAIVDLVKAVQDGKRAATSGAGQEVRVWNIE